MKDVELESEESAVLDVCGVFMSSGLCGWTTSAI